MASLETLPGIGPATAADLRAAGIADAAALRVMGADAAYAALLRHGTRPHFIGYYVLHMALQGRPWTDCRGAEKAALRAGFDALVARHRNAPDTLLQSALDEIGLIAPRVSPPRSRP